MSIAVFALTALTAPVFEAFTMTGKTAALILTCLGVTAVLVAVILLIAETRLSTEVVTKRNDLLRAKRKKSEDEP